MSPAQAGVLSRILAETRAEVDARKRFFPLAPADPAVSAALAPAAAGFREAITAPGIAVIAEFKRHSPSAGSLAQAPDVREIVTAYADGGAAAVSVLTEGPNFHGALDDLRVARGACDLPLLRKDFIIDPYQLHEAVQAGADAVLLIVAALTEEELQLLHGCARSLGLDVLVEVHDAAELDRALAAGAQIVGINNRDLRDFSVDLSRTESLARRIPSTVAVVSESGIHAPEQLARLQDLGVAGVLVGEALMRAPDPAGALRALRSFRNAEGAL